MRKHLADVADSDRVEMGLMVLEKKGVMPTRRSSYQATLTIADRTKSIMAKYFGTRDECEAFLGRFSINGVYMFAGRYSKQYDSIIVENTPHEIDDVDRNDFERDIDIMPEHAAGLEERIEGIRNPHIRALLTEIFSDEGLRKRFLTYPAAKRYHHGRDGGLAEHVLEMARIADAVCATYPGIDRDLLLCGCILHDIGKTAELGVHPVTHYTEDGNHIHHIPLGYQMVSEGISRVAGFPAELARSILHMIVSHHGKPTQENPSFMEPKTLEAKALHQIDAMSAQISPAHDDRVGGDAGGGGDGGDGGSDET